MSVSSQTSPVHDIIEFMQISNGDDSPQPLSMIEEIRLTAQQRLRQIEPLIEEAERLRDVLAVIEERSPQPESRFARPQHRRRGPVDEEAAHVPRAAKGANKQLILELIGERPGITSAEIALVTGLKRTVVASTVSRLKRYGELCDHEHGGVCLPVPEDAAIKRSTAKNGHDAHRLISLA